MGILYARFREGIGGVICYSISIGGQFSEKYPIIILIQWTIIK